jgi:hypothetical protein
LDRALDGATMVGSDVSAFASGDKTGSEDVSNSLFMPALIAKAAGRSILIQMIVRQAVSRVTSAMKNRFKVSIRNGG